MDYTTQPIVEDKMKSFKNYILTETLTAITIKRHETKDIVDLYRMLAFGPGAKDPKIINDSEWQKQKKIIGSELGKRARAGDDLAKLALNDRMYQNVDTKGNPIENEPKPKKRSIASKLLSKFFKK